MTYTVFIDDNYHYMDKEYRTEHGEFEKLENAVAASKAIVDDVLQSDYLPGMSASMLYMRYTTFGEDPFIVGPGECEFSAWEYAKARCEIICAAASLPVPR